MEKKVSLAEYLILFAVKAIGFFFRSIPVPITFFIARFLGRVAGLLNPKRRRIAYANLKAAFGDKYTPKQLKQIVRDTYINIGQGIVEVLLLPKIDEKYIEKYVEFENLHIPDELRKNKIGILFLTAHLGTWEVGQVAVPLKGFFYKGIAREQKPYLLNELLNKYRESKGTKIVMKGPGLREVLRTLKSNGMVAMLVDQDAGKTGIFTEFFGRSASWHRGVMEMAHKTGATIVPSFALRKKGPYVKIKFFEPLKLSYQENKEQRAQEEFGLYARLLEKLISDHPDQWLWQHKRWKSSPVKKVLILDDGRTGHLRQSEAIVKILKDIWQEKGYKREDMIAEALQVKCKSSFFRQLFMLCGIFSHKNCQGCMRCARICLDSNSYRELTRRYADIVISAGSQTAVSNYFIARENNAKSIVVMKPPLVGLGKFDLAVIPHHDNPVKSKKIVATDGAMNLIDRDRTKLYKDKLKERTGSLKENVIGLLIGGPSKSFSLDKDMVSTLLDNLISSANKSDADILISTSRRTPEEVEKLVESRMKNEQRCKLLIVPNKENIEGAVEGIIGLASIVVVSQESISMISEAATSDSYTLVFRKEERMDARHEAFLKHLSRKGFIKTALVKDINPVVEDVFENNLKQSKLDDIGRVKEALQKLL